MVLKPIADEISFQNKAFKQPLQILETDTFITTIYKSNNQKNTKKKYKLKYLEKDTITKKNLMAIFL